MNLAVKLCPCCSSLPYAQCCEPLHMQQQQANSPLALMRSRYSAFVLALFDYLIDTHDANHRHDLTAADLAKPPHPHWLGLDIISHSSQGEKGQVTFKAWYRLDGQIDAIFECSDFILRDGRWYYTQGQQFDTALPGRNDPCICHSGKKFKQCCLTR